MASIIDKHGNVAFFGKLSWANTVDWMVTFCLGGIIMLTTIKLGGVRPDTHLAILPLYAILLTLHGLWFVLNRESPKRLSYIPLLFIPALLWMLLSVVWRSPVPWLGWYEFVYALQAFIVLWVLINNVRTRAHLWCLILFSLLPATVATFNGFYQFFQDPKSMVDAMTPYPLVLHAEFLGRATGSFADPNSFAAFLTILMPLLLVGVAVKRLPLILRLLCFYIAVMLLIGIVFTQAYWSLLTAVMVIAVVPWFCFRKVKTRALFSLLGALSVSLIFTGLVVLHPLFAKGIKHAASVDGEGVRIVLWDEGLAMFAESPIFGQGAGAYGAAFEQSSRVHLPDSPNTPHNDFVLILSQYGAIGALLLVVPVIFIVLRALRVLGGEPYAIKPMESNRKIMPPKRFFISIGFTGFIACGLCMCFTFLLYVPALVLYLTLTFCILVKASFARSLAVPGGLAFRFAYLFLALGAGWSFYVFGAHKLEAQALELRGRQQLDHLVDMRVHVSGNTDLLDQVIVLYEDALIVDESNVDAWIGLSSAVCQLYFQNPSEFDSIGSRAVTCAERAVALGPQYWMSWAQLGVANALYGDAAVAEASLLKALELAPNSSNAHYYYAAFLGGYGDRREEALSLVEKALRINPGNSAARRLEQKLLIL